MVMNRRCWIAHSLRWKKEGRERDRSFRSRLECVLLVTFMTVQTQNQGFSEK